MARKPLRTWTGVIDRCDICESNINRVFYDGQTQGGPWAIMCNQCMYAHGKIGGIYQKYELTKIGDTKFWVDSRDLIDTVIVGNRKA